MRRVHKLGAVAAAAAVLLGGAMLVARRGDAAADDVAMAEPAPAPALIARGAYLAAEGDCAACHTAPGGAAVAGGLRMEIPIGAIYTTNITPDREHGIGRFTLADFDRALRFGVADGHSLYPAMPYTSYANTRPQDVAALYAYFRFGVAPAATPDRPADIAFPLSMRWPLTYWRWAFAPAPRPFAAPAGVDPALARGAYFVDGLGHCGECHTPRAVTLQLEAGSAADGTAYLAGAKVDGWFAPSLRSAGPGSLADWSVQDLAEFLRTGINAHGAAFGSMTEVVAHSTQHLTEADAVDAARYLKSVADPTPASAHVAYDGATAAALRAGGDQARGARVYLDNCASCHRPDGKGYDRVFPPLAGNAAVLAADPSSVVSVVLGGATTARTPSTAARFTMPSFAWRLSDQDVADVASFVRGSWGNGAQPVDAGAVAALRRHLPPKTAH